MHRFFSFVLLFTGLLLSTLSWGQVIPPPQPVTSSSTDSLLLVEILPGVRKLEFRKVNDSTQLQILAGNVKLKQGTSYFYCDSCVINNNTKTFEEWGNVHINDSDTAHIYSSHLRYLMNKRIAYLDGGVRLTDGKGSLTTPDLEYDMTTDFGIYTHGGKVINKKTVLTSQEGYYYAGLRDVYFKKNVKLKDPAYYIETDSLLYNTESQTTRFIAETFIKDSSGRTIKTKEGYYNIATGKAEFGQRPIIQDGKTTIIANRIAFDDSAGTSQAIGNVIIVDSAQGTTILAGEVYRDNKNDRLLATRKPLMIIKQDNDSIYVTADTLFSARLTDLYGKKDSVVKDTVKGTKVVTVSNAKDSTNRYFEAYRHVRIFADSMQAVCDSLFYSFKDSTFR
ncbi:MAG TPA: OstA-like protein, partial [Chitinophagaceae bacterium]|nr:OstA-like protein [Chitinophagaceae bacterium]